MSEKPMVSNNQLASQSASKQTDQEAQQALEEKPISYDLTDNLQQIQSVFDKCGDIVIIPWGYGPGLEQRACSIYLSTLVNDLQSNYMKKSLQDLVPHEVGAATTITIENVIDFFEKDGASSGAAFVANHFDQTVMRILSGDVVIFFDRWNKALCYGALKLKQRQFGEPITEPVVQGPHTSTIEDIDSNIGTIRSLLKSPNLKFEYRTVGEESRRRMAFGYLHGTVNPEVLNEFEKRISDIDQEEILETSFLEEWLGECALSPFPQVRYTERPDVAVASLLGGKIVVMVHGTPTILICPVHFFDFFETSEDYYHRSIFSTLIRLLRFAAFATSLLLPSAYIAISTFHSELMPTVLLLAILDTREGIPFPAFVEALIMEIFFEMLREAGIRLPRPIGSAVSIVGALVIGQAAIQAKIASPMMVIVVSLTGIASFALPQYSMAIGIRILRFPLMALAASFGGLGIMVGLLTFYLHLVTLRSLGQPYLAPAAPLDWRRLWNVFIVPSRKSLLHSSRYKSSNSDMGRNKL